LGRGILASSKALLEGSGCYRLEEKEGPLEISKEHLHCQIEHGTKLGEFLLGVFNFVYCTNMYSISCLKFMTLPFLDFFAFLDFSRNCLATHELSPGDTCDWAQFSGFPYEPPGGWRRPVRRRIRCCQVSLVCLVYQWCGGVWIGFYCTYMIGMTRMICNGGNCKNN